MSPQPPKGEIGFLEPFGASKCFFVVVLANELIIHLRA
jgi:hypothetical protein